MNTAHRMLRRVVFQAIGVTLVWLAMAAIGAVARGQVVTQTVGAVGGVSIDTDSVLRNAREDDSDRLSKIMRQSLEKIPGDLNPAVVMRKISLRGVAAALAVRVPVPRGRASVADGASVARNRHPPIQRSGRPACSSKQ